MFCCPPGSLSPDHHVPVAGSREDGHGYFTPLEGKDPLVELMITTYCDDTVYQNDSGSLTLLHQRSPPLKVRTYSITSLALKFA